jgi:hypothetical protein
VFFAGLKLLQTLKNAIIGFVAVMQDAPLVNDKASVAVRDIGYAVTKLGFYNCLHILKPPMEVIDLDIATECGKLRPIYNK